MQNPLSEKLSSVPQKPGVYILKGPKERILYVGKAKNLRNRLQSYFQKSSQLDIRKSSMIRNVQDFSFIVTDNELEALALEANLIKQYKPRFNVILRDDKNYPYIRLTINDEWPRLEVVRRIKKDGSMYFGPYVPAGSMWEALAFIRRNFNIRPCKYKLDKPMRPCIQYQMGRCPAPCAGYVSRKDYMKAVDEVILFLKGQNRQLLDELQRKMQKFSDELRYEEAAKIRDRINALKRAWESQRVISPELGDIDVVGFYTEGKDAVFQVFFIRNGIMIGAKDFYLRDIAGMPLNELMHSFLEMFYAKEIIPPEEIVTGVKPDGLRSLTAWLRQRRSSKIKITVPSEGKRLELLRMAEENARVLYRSRKSGGVEATLEELKQRLSLKALPHSIGAFDVSSISGSEAVGAFVCWADGAFRKDMYRHLKIKTVTGVDDYAMMEETVKRVLKDIELPELIIIDGGKGHLEAAKKAIGGLKLDVVAVAKRPDRAFISASDEPIWLEDHRASSLLLRKIRDEVHRFAISFHKKLRKKKLMESPLEKIPGVGKKRRLSLLKHFGSIDAIRDAEVEELAKVPGMNRKVAEAVKKTI
jgi:excinuclease ABC subunit C